ncbi:glycosyl hydrolase family 10 [Apiospora rasikravindrae]|uniref:Beta-xylanase n=1 Tax=Apiospora rasikravindrae TaxID=990691 RepID=A0ABR1S2R0_9PEZI
MHGSLITLAALLSFTSAQLNTYAKNARLKYFGAATDSPGQRERAGLEASYDQYDAILRDGNEFGSTTPTNGQKWLFTEPEQGVFNFTEGDIVTSIAQEQGLIQRCHALVWHSQLAPWVDNATAEWTPETLSAVIVEHVTNVMNHYRGKCYAWDVVNEALDEDGSYRDSVFYRVLGEDFIKLAFRTAAAVEPGVKLYYNDYNIEKPSPKSEGVLRIVRMLQEDGIKIDGVGLQGHFVASRPPTLDEQIATIDAYGALGVEVAYTELDVRQTTPVNETSLEWQANAYRDAVGACVQAEACIGVTIWDFYDPFSWVPYTFPGEGAALLWFEDFAKHPAYDAIIDVLKNGTVSPCKRKAHRRAQVAARSAKLQ